MAFFFNFLESINFSIGSYCSNSISGSIQGFSSLHNLKQDICQQQEDDLQVKKEPIYFVDIEEDLKTESTFDCTTHPLSFYSHATNILSNSHDNLNAPPSPSAREHQQSISATQQQINPNNNEIQLNFEINPIQESQIQQDIELLAIQEANQSSEGEESLEQQLFHTNCLSNQNNHNALQNSESDPTEPSQPDDSPPELEKEESTFTSSSDECLSGSDSDSCQENRIFKKRYPLIKCSEFKIKKLISKNRHESFEDALKLMMKNKKKFQRFLIDFPPKSPSQMNPYG